MYKSSTLSGLHEKRSWSMPCAFHESTTNIHWAQWQVKHGGEGLQPLHKSHFLLVFLQQGKMTTFVHSSAVQRPPFPCQTKACARVPMWKDEPRGNDPLMFLVSDWQYFAERWETARLLSHSWKTLWGPTRGRGQPKEKLLGHGEVQEGGV